jgi:hypothetical protein
MSVKWKDETSYSQGEAHPRTPRVWRADLPGVTFKVHRYHGCAGWFLTCRVFEIDTLQLKPESLVEARAQATAKIQIELEKRIKQYQQAVEIICEAPESGEEKGGAA